MNFLRKKNFFYIFVFYGVLLISIKLGACENTILHPEIYIHESIEDETELGDSCLEEQEECFDIPEEKDCEDTYTRDCYVIEDENDPCLDTQEEIYDLEEEIPLKKDKKSFSSEDIDEPCLDTQEEEMNTDAYDKCLEEDSNKTSPNKMSIPIQGLVFTDLDTKKESFSCEKGIVIQKDLLLPNRKEFEKVVNGYLGQPLTMEVLKDVQKEVISYYRKQGFPIVDVYIPSGQNVTNGCVHIVIFLAKVGKVRIEGAKYFSSKKLEKKVRLHTGDVINGRHLVDDIDWLNDNPYRSVDLIYEKGEDLGTSDLVLKVNDRYPLKVYGGYENSGYQVAGSSRWTAGIQYGNLFGIDHQINMQFMSAMEVSKWWNISGNYIAPLPWRNTFKAFGSFVRTRPTSTDHLDDESYSINGKFWQIGLRYEIPLKTYKTYSHVFSFGYDFKRTNNFLSFSPVLLFDKYIDISQFLLRYEGVKREPSQMASFGLSLYLSPGSFAPYNHDKYFAEEREGASSNYMYGVFNIDYLRWLWKGFTLAFTGLLQLSSGKLLPYEQLSLGGQHSVRGYLENEVIGDRGVLVKTEFRTPPLRFFPKKVRGDLQFLAFLDIGFTNDADQEILSKESAFLASIGPGLRYDFKKNVSVRLDYGVQLKSVKGRFFGDNRHSRLHAGIFMMF